MRPRCRELGVRLGILEPGARNTIADVGEVRVGHVSLVSGEGKLVPGRGPVRTGGTGTVEMREFGVLETPIGLTNTMCVGNVAIGLIEWTLAMNPDAAIGESTVVPTVSECDDSDLNDARGLHVKASHAREALAVPSQDFQMGTAGAG